MSTALVDEDSFFEVKPLFARELVTGFARLDGATIGIVANNPMHLGGVLFTDSADKAARFIWLCDAFNVPLLFLADVPGFMIGSKVEREGIIRHGAKMITAVAEATVPKISVIVRKAYGAGLYAMCGPAFDPDACLALPSAQIAVMGPEPAVNAVFFNKIQAIEDPDERAAFVAEQRAEYEADVDLDPARGRARGRRGRRARGPAGRADRPVRARADAGARRLRAPARRPARLADDALVRRLRPLPRAVRGDARRRRARRAVGPSTVGDVAKAAGGGGAAPAGAVAPQAPGRGGRDLPHATGSIQVIGWIARLTAGARRRAA